MSEETSAPVTETPAVPASSASEVPVAAAPATTESNSEITSVTPAATAGEAAAPVLSKRQRNRLLREQQRKESWKAKRKQERERKKQKRAAAAAAAKENNTADSWVARKRKKTMWKEIDELGIKPSATVVIDLFFSDKMTPKESKSLINQICYSYSYNGRSKVVEDNDNNNEEEKVEKVSVEKVCTDSDVTTTINSEKTEKEVSCDDDVSISNDVTTTTTKTVTKRIEEIPKFFNIVMSSFKGQIVEFAERLGGKEFWKFTSWDERHLTEIYPKEKIVYLTSESDNVLDDVVDDKVYVIGGIVDHNRLKGITHEDATKRGIYTARLPLDQYVDMQSRKVLTVNHVFMILLGVLNTHDWAKTLSVVLPKRKDPHFKTAEGGGDDDDNEEEEEENEGASDEKEKEMEKKEGSDDIEVEKEEEKKEDN